MSRYLFELAGPADEADLRHVLAATPMAGRIAVAFRREPDFFAAAAVAGRFHQVVACRDRQSGRIVGFGERSVMDRYVNGTARPIGYLGGLRLLAEHRNRGLLGRGFAFFRRQHADGRTPLYLTTIAEGNAAALDVLLGGRAGLPRYHFAGRYHTLALPPRRRRRRPPAGLVLRPARAEDEPAILDLLRREGPRRQFFPCYREGDLFAGGLFVDLRPGDVWLAWRGGELVGLLGVWDQHRYKQAVVCGYDRLLGWLRPLYNGWARLSGATPLPAAGEAQRYRSAALPVVSGADGEVFGALLAALRDALAGGPDGSLMLGLHEADPLWPAARRLGGVCYTTRLYLACWEDGEELRQGLDGRPPYLELGCL
jgi:hypothetical protein